MPPGLNTQQKGQGMKQITLWVVVITMAFSQMSNAGELLMKNGSRLIGTVVSAEAGKVVIDTPFAGEIEVSSENIDTMYTDADVTVMMADGSVIENQRIVSRDDALVITGPDNQSRVFEATDIDMINPEPWRLGRGYKWTGDTSMAMLLERGNTDSDELDVAAESIWRSLDDRYTLRGSMEIDKANSEKNKDQWQVRGKYDRFRRNNPDDYYGWQLYFESDDFADLDLRTITGPYVGRQFFESSLLDLAGEIGVVYVDEQFEVAEDDDFWGGNWEFRLTSDYLSKYTEFYLNQTGILNFEDIDGVIINTTIGMAFPFKNGFQAAVEAQFEYDGGAVEGVDDTDETYNIRIGYTW